MVHWVKDRSGVVTAVAGVGSIPGPGLPRAMGRAKKKKKEREKLSLVIKSEFIKAFHVLLLHM